MAESASYDKIPVTTFVNDPPLPAKKPAGNKDENAERGNWSSQMDFMLSCIGYAVGLGNVWRFPYLCYSNGGGAFLIPYIIMLLFAGIPLFFLELSIGQYGSNGPIKCWRSVPAIRGVGYGMVAASAFVGIYYNVIICYTIFYMIQSLTSVLPWEDCHHSWNSYLCSELYDECIESDGIITHDGSCASIANLTMEEKAFYNVSDEGNLTHYKDPFHDERVGPSEEFYRNGALHDSGSIEESGYVIWQLALCLLLAWGIVFLCLAKGIKSSGKVVWFTATFPYVVLFILLIRGVTLPGCVDGILFFITPKWELLKNPKVWKDAAVQIFYSLSASWGGLTTLSSYNRFKNNCFRDAMIVPILNCMTSVFAGFVIFSILGAMAYELKKPVEDVIAEQFGLAFVAYPEAVTHMPASPVWSFLFFFMLLTLGLDSQFCIIETVVTAITDQFPSLRPKKTRVMGAYCIACFFIGLICVTQAGSYWVALMDKYAADFSLLIFALMECIGIGWIYGYKRFTNDIRTMVGNKIVDSVFFYWWPINWCFITPVILSAVLIFNWSSWSPPTAGDYEFPVWAHVIGWILITLSIVWIPVVWVYEFVKAEGSIKERLVAMTTPTESWGPALPEHRNEAYYVHQSHGTDMGGTLEGAAPEDYVHVDQNGVALSKIQGEHV